MPIIDGIFCFVHTPEGPLKEFPCVDGPSSSSASVYILARDGQEFSIKCSVPSPGKHMPVATDGLAVQLRIDGVDEKPGLLGRRRPTISINGTMVFTPTGNWELRKFLFSSIELTEERSHDELTLENVNKLGEITVSLRRFKLSGLTRISSGSGPETKRAVIHEKSIKGRDISHSVQRAKGEYCAPSTSSLGTYLDPEDHPLMTFRFIYKSERALKNMGLIERSPSPPPYPNTERNSGPVESSPVKNEKVQLKRERGNPAGPSKRTKKRRQEVSLDDIETIDLTGGN